MSNVPSIQELRLGRAYGIVSHGRRADTIARIDPVSAPRTTGDPGAPRGVDRLVGAIVPGAIAFDPRSGAPTPTEAPLSIYRSPADRNAAAVGIQLGRTLDLRG